RPSASGRPSKAPTAPSPSPQPSAAATSPTPNPSKNPSTTSSEPPSCDPAAASNQASHVDGLPAPYSRAGHAMAQDQKARPKPGSASAGPPEAVNRVAVDRCHPH